MGHQGLIKNCHQDIAARHLTVTVYGIWKNNRAVPFFQAKTEILLPDLNGALPDIYNFQFFMEMRGEFIRDKSKAAELPAVVFIKR